MAETSNVSLQPTLESFFHTLDPISQILAQKNSDSDHPLLRLRLTALGHGPMERGPSYEAYAQLRESKLRLKLITQQQQQEELACSEPDPKVVTPPPTKLVRFRSSSQRERYSAGRSSSGRKGYSVLAQSVPDFSAAALRKENRKPVSTTPPLPAAKSLSRSSSVKGSKSANIAGEKRGGGILMARKSHAAMDELRNFSAAVGNAIKGENRGGGRKTVLGCSKFGF
ncbi:uncharacterized protein LOC114760762 [Neltuma alba]|uniref:uncharacterized protein LOC114760762 n=1 Tax=Neltuma alba TaxID=207710 RepID=UPI0010A30879|nr:uncharacterized protein LOC114760762 [Prosopis alba]